MPSTDTIEPARATGNGVERTASTNGSARLSDIRLPTATAPSHRAWKVRASAAALRTTNPIRQVVDRMDWGERGDGDKRPTISLSIGDPTIFGNLVTSDVATEAVAEVVRSKRANGYPPSVGYEQSRAAVAQVHSDPAKGIHLTANDVVLTSGCSHALQLCIGALADPGTNVLVPKPGFALYRTLLENAGVEIREYPLIANQNWAVDLEALDDLIDHRSAAIVLNNPSNPCGAVFSAEHIGDILRLCEQRRLPIIADEIYEGLVFGGTPWCSLAEINVSIGVPMVCVGGLAKSYLVPGWRLGWILIHDVQEALAEVREGLYRLSTLTMGPNSLVQVALPTILRRIPPDWHKGLIRVLQRHADVSFHALSQCPGLRPYKAKGAMYIMTEIRTNHFRDIPDDLAFAQMLFNEEGVIVLPGRCFSAPNFFRVTYCAPEPELEDAYGRIMAFCRRHLHS